MDQSAISTEFSRTASPATTEAQPPSDRPLDLLLAGGLLAAGTLAGMLAIAYKCWIAGEVPESTAILFIGLLSFVFTAGVFLFSYGWERQDVAKAVRLTAILVALSAATAFIAVLALAVFAKIKGGRGPASALPAHAGRGPLGLPLAVLGSLAEADEVGLDGGEPKAGEQELFTITCGSCHQRFIPLPPTAVCPNCGQPAVTVA